MIKGISTSVGAKTSYEQSVLVVNSPKHFKYRKCHFIISCEFADLNSCCMFILVSDQLCIPLCLSIFYHE